jgi:hypothetical protein
MQPFSVRRTLQGIITSLVLLMVMTGSSPP